MSYLTRLLKQTATYWAPSSVDKYGDPSFVAPTTFPCRWEDKSDLVIQTGKGDEKQVRAAVYSTTAVAVDGYLFLGTSTQTNPENQSGADRILSVENCPDVANKKSLYKILL